MSIKVDGGPTKRFFVSMLTRDIDLKDAILDLLDNCVDGIVRNAKPNEASLKPYSGFWAKITATPQGFEIWDNCGGIPHKIATESAFRLGRPDHQEESVHTVGMYGIGMKRAIFKMGQDAKVLTKSHDGVLAVEFTKTWLASDNWELEAITLEGSVLSDRGTKITVNDLYPSISYLFNSTESDFLNELAESISQQYSRIMEKGFQIYLNDKVISPLPLQILFSGPNDNGIQPYIFRGTISNVEIELIVGFHRKLATEKEVDEESIETRKSTNAGWTIICNDRVVLYKDKSKITGWGLGKVPQYHTQFISISGQVEFKSKVLLNLPLNTTKRGIDSNSEVYLTVLQEMMNGLKQFTDFTNKWKGREQETNLAFENAKLYDPSNVVIALQNNEKIWSNVRNISTTDKAVRFIPELPTPPATNPTRRIVFIRPVEQVKLVAKYLTGDSELAPAEVGGLCFDNILRAACKSEGVL